MAQWAALVCEAFDTRYREGLDSGRLFVLPLHPWCIGQPFRVKYLDHVLTHDEVWTTTGGEIAAWYRRLSHDHRRENCGVGRSAGPRGAVGGMTILVVEQNAGLALRASDRAYVLSTGSVVLEGRAQDLLEDEAVRKEYLG